MRLATHVVEFEAHGLTMLGNLATGSLIGLTDEGRALCRRMREDDMPLADIPESCQVLVQHLTAGNYLAKEGPGTVLDGTPRVSSAYLHVTQRCNLACAFCYSGDATRNVLPDPTISQLYRALDLLAAWGVKKLVVSGGEPFLRDDLATVVTHAKELEVEEVAVLTNGLLCTKELVEPLVGLVDCIGVAFDGYGSDCLPHLRDRRVFDHTVRAVQTIVECGIPARVLPTIHALNLNDMPRYQELADSLGATVSYSLLTAPSDRLGELLLSDEQLKLLGSSALLSQLSLGEDLASGGVRIAARNSCGACSRTLSVAADGTVYPCHMLHKHSLGLGNAFEDGAAQIARNMSVHPCTTVSVDDIEECKNCSMRYLCGGGCRARSYLDTRGFEVRDPYCALYRTYYNGVIEALAQQYHARPQE